MTDREIEEARAYYGDGGPDPDGPKTLLISRTEAGFLLLTGPVAEVTTIAVPPGHDPSDGPPARVLEFVDRYFAS